MIIMLAVLIALILAAIYLFVEIEYQKQQDLENTNWSKRARDPDFSPEKQQEEDLQRMMNNPKDYWKEYL